MKHLYAIATCLLASLPAFAGELRIAPFEADVTPPLGTPLCDALVQPAKEIVDPLSARGVVILTNDKPIVLCALDWVGIGNSGYNTFRDVLAKAAGTTRERVCVHCLHQHDAPGCDFEADEVLASVGLGGKLFDPIFAHKAANRIAAAIKKALDRPQHVTHLAFGKAKVEHVAATRRVMGADGKVKYVRYSATKDPLIRAEPEGVFDPYLQLVSFWDADRPVASLTYYATHPQSYYGKGGVSCDFPGLARGLRERATPGVLHVHFNGAGGNVTAGKYNDGSPENRMILAQRLAKGMQEAYDSARRLPVKAEDVQFRVKAVALPLSKLYNTKDLKARIADEKLPTPERIRAARNYVWARRCEAGEQIDVTCLRLGPAYLLHMPGELFVEYQLAAQKMRPDSPVLMAAYGDYGPGYIGTAVAYSQGGYETGPVSRVAPEVEVVLVRAMQELLQ